MDKLTDSDGKLLLSVGCGECGRPLYKGEQALVNDDGVAFCPTVRCD